MIGWKKRKLISEVLSLLASLIDHKANKEIYIYMCVCVHNTLLSGWCFSIRLSDKQAATVPLSKHHEDTDAAIKSRRSWELKCSRLCSGLLTRLYAPLSSSLLHVLKPGVVPPVERCWTPSPDEEMTGGFNSRHCCFNHGSCVALNASTDSACRQTLFFAPLKILNRRCGRRWRWKHQECFKQKEKEKKSF